MALRLILSWERKIRMMGEEEVKKIKIGQLKLVSLQSLTLSSTAAVRSCSVAMAIAL